MSRKSISSKVSQDVVNIQPIKAWHEQDVAHIQPVKARYEQDVVNIQQS